MLPQQRCGPADFPGRLGKFIERARILQRASCWVVDGGEEAARFQVRIVEQVPHGRDRRNWHPARLRFVVQCVDRLIFHPVLQQGVQHIPVRPAAQAVSENHLTRPLWVAHDLHKPLPLMFFHAAQKNPAVLAFEKLKRLDRLLSKTRGNQIHVGKKLKSQLQNRQQAFLG